MINSIPTGLTFDDILLLPNKSNVDYNNINLQTYLTKNIKLNIPIISAAMDTVTESATAIALAQLGGVGIIHKNLSPSEQAAEVKKVKRAENGIITEPISIEPNLTVADAKKIMKSYNISGLPVVKKNVLVGILTNRDLRFEENDAKKIKDVMTRRLITAKEGTTLEKAKKILQKNKIEKLPIVDDKNYLRGLITIKDIINNLTYPNSSKDRNGRLLVGAAVGAEPHDERVALLIEAGADIIVVDKAHGFTDAVIKKVKFIKRRYENVEVIAGNVVTGEATEALINAGADAVKVGIGPGSICTTRVIAGVGMPQIMAVRESVQVSKKYKIPVIADGGIKYSGDIVKAIAVGASTVMLGNLLAGTQESPGEVVYYQGRSYKVYRGMGSVEAMKEGGKERYFQKDEFDINKLVPEGIVGRVPYKGPVEGIIHQLVGGIKSGMVYTGANTLKELQKKAKFVRITASGLQESHPHDINIVKEAPNYRPL